MWALLAMLGIAVAFYLVRHSGRSGSKPGFTQAKAQGLGKIFRCAKCSATALHTARTLKAARTGKSRFYCPDCHRDWARSNSAANRSTHGSIRNAGRTGCLGAIAALVVVRLVVLLVWLGT